MSNISNGVIGNGVNGVGDGFYQHRDEGFETRAVQVGQSPDQWESGIVVPPIHTGTTFKQNGPGDHKGFEYGRSGNPTRKVLEVCLASLEKAKYALTFSSGLATVTGVCALLKAGDHVICGDDVYGGTNRYFKNIGKNHGLDVDFIDTTVIENVEKAIKPNTKMVWVESPTNPTLKVMDTPNLAKAIKAINKDILLVVDNTFLTPYLHKPLSMGADIVVYSLTKYMNGHSDVIMGSLATNSEDIYNRMTYNQNSMGIVPSPFDCYLVNRSLKTLAIRMDRHVQNATRVARFLEQHPLIERVLYPGLESHPQHKLAKQLWYGPSGVLSVYIKGDLKTSTAFLKALRIFILAESLGGFESLAELPSIMTHASVPEEERKQLNISDNLIRLSVGLESAEDLVNDLDQALKVAASAS